MLAAYFLLLAATTLYSAVLAQHRATPHIGHPAPHVGHPAPHVGHPAPHTGHPAPHTGHPAPHTGHPAPHHGTGPHHHHTDWPPRPYAFMYNALLHDHVHHDGKISRSETRDETGRVEGSYSLEAEGYSRTVDYVADKNGFRAHVRTNEPGTSNKNPADVVMESTYDGHTHHHHGGHHGTIHH